MKRCEWANRGELEQSYHDNEWGVVLHDDRSLFEFLILEGAQAGLSWSTILKKREGYRTAFHNFDARKSADIPRRMFHDYSLILAWIRTGLKSPRRSLTPERFCSYRKNLEVLIITFGNLLMENQSGIHGKR